TKVRLNSNHDPGPSPTFVPLTLFRGVAGIAFLCFGELFWMHLSRVGLDKESAIMGSMALTLGAVMVLGAVCGAAGIMFSADEAGRLPLVASVHLSAPLSLADFVVAVTFAFNRAQILRWDLRHEEERGEARHRSPPGHDPSTDPGDDPESRAESFQRLYDVFIALALAFSVVEMLIFRLGRRRLVVASAASVTRTYRGGVRSIVSSNTLQSLLDEDDLEQAKLDGWPGDVQQNREMEQRYEQLSRASLVKNEGLLAHARGGNNNSL
ncbi:unnamed protein product, partial [Ascophyllum nodosum]